MQLIFDDGYNQQELDMRVNRQDATVADLVSALVGSNAGGVTLSIGDHPAQADLGLAEAGLCQGAVLRLLARTGSEPIIAGHSEIRVVGGFSAGRRFPVSPGELVLGRDPQCDIVIAHPTASRRHCRLTIAEGGSARIADLSSRTGTWIDGKRISAPAEVTPSSIFEVGDVQLAVGPPLIQDRPLSVDPLRHASPTGTIPFNRPPRPGTDPALALLATPNAPAAAAKPVFGVASTVAPLVFAGVMTTVNPAFALFALASPLMQLGNWYESHRRAKGTFRREGRTFREELQAFREMLEERLWSEVRQLRDLFPDPAETVRRAILPSVRLWERRPGHGDFLHLTAGLADLPWSAPLDETRGDLPSEVAEVLMERASLPLVPVPVDLSDGGVVGIVGDRAAALILARNLLCQAGVHHGPADLEIAVLTRPDRTPEWDWIKWLPHTQNPAGGGESRLLAGRPEECEALFKGLLERNGGKARPAGPVTLAVIDAEELTEGRDAPARKLLRGTAGPVAGIIIATSEDRLPALCNTIVEVRSSGEARLTRPQTGERIDSFPVTGMDEELSRQCARALARFEDPELSLPGARLPHAVSLLSLLGLPSLDSAAIRSRWRSVGEDPSPATPVGMSEEGVFFINLVRHGPHGLIGGTTGSGKSELLRTLVAGLAATLSPEHVTFVLIDFKGGSTFDECERLPHTVGLATDLDEQLAERALRCLRAELRYREARFHEAGVPDLPAYRVKRRQSPAGQPALEPMPRLVVIIDEFAEMAAALPDFLDSLIGIARRGRSLGVHMILATQKPAGAVNDNIRANTDLKIALRVQEKADSVDVVGVPHAAGIPRNLGGRAYVRLGPSDVVPIQTALATGVSLGGSIPPVELAPFCFGPSVRTTGISPASHRSPEAPTDLARLVGAIQQAFASDEHPLPRKPWTDPLPPQVLLDSVVLDGQASAGKKIVTFALADDPEAQTRYPVGWDLAAGNLLLYGILGSGTTTALTSLSLALARAHAPAELHLYVLDFGAGDLHALEGLPHVGAVIGSGERERQIRLVRFVRGELERRKQLRGPARDSEPALVLILDGFAAFSAAFDDAFGLGVAEDLIRVYADGPEVRIHIAITADRVGAIPGSMSALTKQKMILRLPDASEYGFFGISRRQVPAFTPGRALLAETAQEIQIACPPGSLTEAVAVAAKQQPLVAGSRSPAPISVLPDEVALEDILETARVGATMSSWFLPIGIGDRTLEPAGLVLYEGEHAVIGGPARSGRTNALLVAAALVKKFAPDIGILGVALRRSPLRDSPHLDRLAVTPIELAEALDAIGRQRAGYLVLIDDAEGVEDPEGKIASLLALGRPDVHLMVAGRTDSLRAAYGHWTQSVRRSKLGVLLKPDPDLDGDLLGVQLPRRGYLGMRTGRGFLVDNSEIEIVQMARDREMP